MKAKIQAALFCTFLILIFVACDDGNGGGYDGVTGDEATSAPTTSTTTSSTTSTLPPTTTTSTTTSTSTTTFTIFYQPSYQQIRVQFVGPYCMACHSKEGGNQGGVNLESYENVRDRATFIRQVLHEEHLEYYRTHIPESVKESLNRWINMGAPE